MLTHLLDTSVYSERLKPHPHPAVDRRWEELGDEALGVSAICHGELLFGIEAANSERLRAVYANHLAGRLPIIAVDEEIVEAYAKLKADTRRGGRPRGEFDLLIAATAKVHHLIVATLNFRHFTGLEGVAVEDWSR